jgi:hypothetical protein
MILSYSGMIFNVLKNNSLLIIIFLFSTSFYSYNDLDFDTESEETDLNFEVLNYFDIEIPNYVFLQRDFNGFKELLAFKESTGNYKRINKFGYMGKFQFNLNTLKMYRVFNAKKFINNPKLQERVFLINVQRNKWILRKDIKWFVGTKINNIVVTESGIIAAAHLAGPGNVKKYLRSEGAFNSKDAFGTSISMYMEYFKNYDLSMIEAVRKPKI